MIIADAYSSQSFWTGGSDIETAIVELFGQHSRVRWLLVLAHLPDDIVVFIVLVGGHQIVGGRRPAVGVHISGLRFGEVGGREALDRISNILLCEDRECQKEKHQESVLSVEFVHAIVNRHMNAPD